MLKGCIPVTLLFFSDMILPIKRMVDWELICQKNQTQIIKHDIHGNSKRVDHDFKLGDKVTINNNVV